VANVQDGYLDLETITQVSVPIEAVQRHELRPGDILMTEDGDFDKLGRGYVWEGQITGCLHQNHIFAVRPNKRVLDPRFLASLMTSSHGKNYFTSTSQQTTNLASTNSGKIRSFPLPLPPLAEQRQILSFLDEQTTKIDALIAKKQRLIELLQEKRTALISHAVTKGLDPGVPMKESGIDSLDQIPQDWELLSVRRFATAVEQGWSPVAEDRQAEDEEWAVIKLSAIHKGNFRSSEHKALPKDLIPERRYEIKDGDFLITRSNTPDLVGDVCVVDSARSRLMLCDLVYRVQVDEKNRQTIFVVPNAQSLRPPPDHGRGPWL
jgi:type I restriction enzyme, S subunit